MCLAALACGGGRPAAPTPQVIPDPRANLPEIAVAPPETVVRPPTPDSILATLSLEEKVGQVLMPWLPGDYSAFDSDSYARAVAWVDSSQIGGLIISFASSASPLDAALKLNALQRRSRLPLLVAADLEFGAGMRLAGATAFPNVMAIGATGSELDAYELGRVTALEARAVGIHWTFSPVGDLNSNPLNPIINTRSFGEDPGDVAKLVGAYVRGAGEHGLYTTVKHFPGHGDTGTDSHLALPVLQGCWDRLDRLELVPFRAAIRAGATAVMVAHIVYACDVGGDSLPATLSPAITTGFLRDSLEFRGLVVTDALTMGAIINRFGPGESAVRAFLAGSDMLLMPADLRWARTAMLAAVDSGRISRERLDSSVRRVLELKTGAGLFSRRTVPLDSIPLVVGQKAFQNLADDIAQRSLTLVTRGPIDQYRAQRGRVAVITYAEETNLAMGGTLVEALRTRGETVTTFRLYPPSGAASYDSARALIRNHPRVIVASSVRPIAGRGHVALPDSLAALIQVTAAQKPTVLVSFGSPYLLSQVLDFRGAYLLAWSDAPATERAVARALTGEAPIRGKSPVQLSPLLPRGTGIMIP
jgi:beta-glucosidase-like glycosyl hydrolase